MKSMKLIVCLFGCLFIGTGFAKEVVNIQQWRMHNGVKVLFVQAKQIPMLDMAVVFKAGAVYDAKQKGLANLSNAMFNEGAGGYDVNQLAEQFDDVGAQFNNNVNKEMSIIMLRTLTKPMLLKAALKTFSLVLTKPTFPQSSIARLKKQMLINLKMSQQQPDYIAGRAFAKAVWGKHPYANPLAGTLQSIPTLTRAAVQQFYHRYYVAKNAMLVMVGDVSLVQAHVISQQLVGALPQGKAAPPIPVVSDNHGMTQHIDFPASQNTILIGEVGVKHSNPAHFPLLLGNYILGGGGSLNSILMRAVREKYGLTYGVYSQLLSLTQRGAFVISLRSRNDQAARASNITQDYLENYLATRPTVAELKAAKDFLIGSFPLGISSNDDLLQNLIYIGYYHLPLNFLDTYRQKIKAVTTNQIKTAFNRYLQLKRLIVISVGGKQ